MENVLLTFCVGFAVAFIFFKLKVPGGMLIGAVCGTVALSLTTGMAEMPLPRSSSRRLRLGPLSAAP